MKTSLRAPPNFEVGADGDGDDEDRNSLQWTDPIETVIHDTSAYVSVVVVQHAASGHRSLVPGGIFEGPRASELSGVWSHPGNFPGGPSLYAEVEVLEEGGIGYGNRFDLSSLSETDTSYQLHVNLDDECILSPNHDEQDGASHGAILVNFDGTLQQQSQDNHSIPTTSNSWPVYLAEAPSAATCSEATWTESDSDGGGCSGGCTLITALLFISLLVS